MHVFNKIFSVETLETINLLYLDYELTKNFMSKQYFTHFILCNCEIKLYITQKLLIVGFCNVIFFLNFFFFYQYVNKHGNLQDGFHFPPPYFS